MLNDEEDKKKRSIRRGKTRGKESTIFGCRGLFWGFLNVQLFRIMECML